MTAMIESFPAVPIRMRFGSLDQALHHNTTEPLDGQAPHQCRRLNV